MNYIKQVNTFYKLIQNNPLSSNAQCLYNYLLNKNNELAWIKEFTVSNMIVCGFTGLSRQALDRARNELKQKGYIDYKKGISNQAGKYLIVNFDTQNDTQSDTQDNIQDDTRSGYRVSTLNKLKNNINNNSPSDDGELQKHFELTWEKYPRKEGKTKALEYYLQWIKGRKISKTIIRLTDKQMYLAVKKYAEKCEQERN